MRVEARERRLRRASGRQSSTRRHDGLFPGTRTPPPVYSYVQCKRDARAVPEGSTVSAISYIRAELTLCTVYGTVRVRTHLCTAVVCTQYSQL